MILGNLLNLGVKPEMEFYEKREVRMVNLFAWIAFIGSVAGITTVFFISARYPTFIALFSVFSSLASLILNYKGFRTHSTYLFVLSTCVSIFVIVQQYEANVGNYLYYFPLIFCVALVHHPGRSDKRTIILYSMVVISFLCAWLLDIESLKNTTVTKRDSDVLLVYNSILTFFITTVLVYLVVKLINNQNNEAINLLSKQKESQLIIAHSLKEKEILLAEIQHRVKNNLAVITALLNLQSDKAPCEESRKLMIESKNRVMSIAMVHERLYKKDNLSKINFKSYLTELVNEISNSFPSDKKITLVFDMENIELELTKAVPVGLIVNEVITNSLKHAFTQEVEKPTLTIALKTLFDKIQISVSDNGKGFSNIESRKPTSLGITLIESLADQIDAKVLFSNENGARVNIVFAS